MGEIYQESYNDKCSEDIPYYLVIGTKGNSFEDDLAIPVTKELLSNKTIKQILEEYILNEDEDSFYENLQLGNIIDIDINLRQRLKNTFKELKNFLTNDDFELYSEPLNLGPGWNIKGQNISEKNIQLEDLILNNLIYVEINAPDQGYVNVRQYMAIFRLIQKQKIKIIPKKLEIINGSKFGPIETPIIDYDVDKFKMLKIEVVKKRIEERKKWLSSYSDIDLLYLIFAPIRFLRFKHSQGKLLKSYAEQGKAKPSIISDIKDNALLGGVWEYKDLEFLNQIDLLISNKIIVPTDFNYHCPPYTTLYKVVKDGVLLVGDIEHEIRCPKEEEVFKEGFREIIKKPGQFITYTCMKKMGNEGTQVLIKYQNEIGTTSKMLTCNEMDMDMADMDGKVSMVDNSMKDIIKSASKPIGPISIGPAPAPIGHTTAKSNANRSMMSKSSVKPARPASTIKKRRDLASDYRSQIYHDPKQKGPRPSESLYRGYRG